MNTKSLKNPRVLTGIALGAVIIGAIFWFLSSTYQVSIFNMKSQEFILGPSMEMSETLKGATGSGFIDMEDGF